METVSSIVVDEAIVAAIRDCPEHGYEMLLQSFHGKVFYLAEIQSQVKLLDTEDDQTVRLGGVYDVRQVKGLEREGLPLLIYTKRCGDTRNKETEYQDEDPEAMFELIEAFDDDKGSA